MINFFIHCLILANIYNISIMEEKKIDQLRIYTPLGDSLDIRIIDPKDKDIFLSRKTSSIDGVSNISRKMPIYKLDDNSIYIGYTVNAYAILLKDEQDYQKIHNDNLKLWGFSLHEVNNKWFYKFKIFSNFIAKQLETSHIDINTNYLRKNVSIKKDMFLFENGNIINCLERVEGVYQGDWFYNKTNLDYFWENSYTSK
jgi:hypothetical protein